MDVAKRAKHYCWSSVIEHPRKSIVPYEQQLTFRAVMAEDDTSIGSAVRAAIHELRAFRAAVCLQLLASAVICGLAGRPMLSGLVDSYQTFLSAAALFGLMALAVALFQERRRVAGDLPATEAYRLAWRTLRAESLTPEYIANVAIILATAPLAISAFSAAKQ